ncbi:MAG: Nif3-like dinuclear metal center hexameric protein [Candidatus Improbicoccus pseudotrichonymphae]|uniref:GTP cyclohydrolase 1 type 2 homolog n=1 Tax=Candidatus Improbicoccus pseudotrichonymphae TaxID=3033792 RepID=A0AA48KZ15_9FIRM|nr:MAG: Nif3-like dinuclear metal center hexameric protein [Candidatus Improbicoccus pseudotrichonymphae]
MNFREIYYFIDSFAPFCTQFEFDNSGLLVGNGNDFVDKILISLDITSEVILEAKNLGVQLIISHHPVIFNKITSISSQDVVYHLIRSGIGAICAHTNLDISPDGVNYCLLKKLDLIPKEPVKIINNSPLGFCSFLNTVMTSQELANFIKSKLECNFLKFTDNNSFIEKIAVVSGAGGDCIYDLPEKDVQGFITGEIKHHEILYAKQNKISVFELGHFVSENVIVEHLCFKLKNKFKNLDVFVSKKNKDETDFIGNFIKFFSKGKL